MIAAFDTRYADMQWKGIPDWAGILLSEGVCIMSLISARTLNYLFLFYI